MGIEIEQYVDRKKILTAEQIKKKAPGSKVRLHSFSRYGEHQWADYTVVQSGNRKMLKLMDYRTGDMIIRRIAKPREGRECYTEV